MANRSNAAATNCARMRPITSQQNYNNICSDSMEDEAENDVMMQSEGDSDNNSIPTTMGVRASHMMDYSNRHRSVSHRRDRGETHASNDNVSISENISSFFIPFPMPPAPGQCPLPTTLPDQKQVCEQEQQMNLDDNDCGDDISTLTEYSMEDYEEDNVSQTTANSAWTCVTEVTNSTAAGAPTSLGQPNFGALDPRNLPRRRILAHKRARVQPSQDNRISRGSEKQKRRRMA